MEIEAFRDSVVLGFFILYVVFFMYVPLSYPIPGWKQSLENVRLAYEWENSTDLKWLWLVLIYEILDQHHKTIKSRP